MDYVQLTKKLGINNKKIRCNLRNDSIYYAYKKWFIRIYYNDWEGRFDAYVCKDGLYKFINGFIEEGDGFNTEKEVKDYIKKYLKIEKITSE